jgi:hypothetical protein
LNTSPLCISTTLFLSIHWINESPRLIPYLAYCEHGCDKCEYAGMCLVRSFTHLWIYTQKWYSRNIWQFLDFWFSVFVKLPYWFLWRLHKFTFWPTLHVCSFPSHLTQIIYCVFCE